MNHWWRKHDLIIWLHDSVKLNRLLVVSRLTLFKISLNYFLFKVRRSEVLVFLRFGILLLSKLFSSWLDRFYGGIDLLSLLSWSSHFHTNTSVLNLIDSSLGRTAIHFVLLRQLRGNFDSRLFLFLFFFTAFERNVGFITHIVCYREVDVSLGYYNFLGQLRIVLLVETLKSYKVGAEADAGVFVYWLMKLNGLSGNIWGGIKSKCKCYHPNQLCFIFAYSL